MQLVINTVVFIARHASRLVINTVVFIARHASRLVINTAVFIARPASRLEGKGSIIHLESINTCFVCFAIGLAINSAVFIARLCNLNNNTFFQDAWGSNVTKWHYQPLLVQSQFELV